MKRKVARVVGRVASVILAGAMLVGSTGVTVFAETGHSNYENLQKYEVSVTAENNNQMNEIPYTNEESSNSMYNNVEECDIPVEVEEIAEPTDVVYADAESELVTYKLYNNKSYEITNTTYTDVALKPNSYGNGGIFEYAVYDSDGLCTSIDKSSYSLPTIRNGSGKEERAVVTINNKNAGDDYYVEVSLHEEVVVEESESPALYHYTLNNHESCTIVNPTNRNMQVKGETSNICDDVLEYVIYDSKGFCTKYELGDYRVSSLGAYERLVITLNYVLGDTYTVDLAIPYKYLKEGAEIKVSEEPAFYTYTLNNHKSCVINNKTGRNVDIADTVGLDYVLDYAKYTADGTCNEYRMKSYDVSSLSPNEKEVITLNYTAGNSYTARIGVPYEYYKEGITIEASDEPAFYKYTLNNYDSCIISNPTDRKVNIDTTNGIDSVLQFAKYDTNDKCIKCSEGLNTWYTYKPDSLSANEKEVVTLKYKAGNTYVAALGIPYGYYKEGVTIEKSENPVFYIKNIKAGEQCAIKSKVNYNIDTYLIGTGQKYCYRLKGDSFNGLSTLGQYTVTQSVNGNGKTYVLEADKDNTGDISLVIPYRIVSEGKLLVTDCEEETEEKVGMVEESDGKKYWYENGIKQGTEGRGKEIYDPETDAWYWLDAIQGGAVATSKDIYQESSGGKWVRYDENGHMIKGWDTNENGKYYFDPITGAMIKGEADIDGQVYCFNADTGIICNNEFFVKDGNRYWYENGIRQGLEGRGKEIYDPATNAWYWLDAIDGGKVATGKDLYQESAAGEWAEDKTTGTGKWVRYDDNGYMVKGWYTNENGTYYFDPIYGTMAKGTVNIDGTSYHFDETYGWLN